MRLVCEIRLFILRNKKNVYLCNTIINIIATYPERWRELTR